MVVLTFLLCHSLRWVLMYMMMKKITLCIPRLVAKVYQVVILDDYLDEARCVT